MNNQEKVIIFSHENDIDGIGNLVLGYMAFGNIDYILASNVDILENKFRKELESGNLYQYDKIFVTDLALYNPSLEMVSKNPLLNNKIKIFDHHKSSINAKCDRFDFVTIIEKDANGFKRCGTDLFYQYLCTNNLLKKTKVLDDFVELTRLEDTWEWKNNGITKAHDLAILFNIIGINNYIESMLTKVKSNKDRLEFTEQETEIINNKKVEYLIKLNNIWREAELFSDEFNNKCAAVFADYEFRNELGEYVKELNVENLKYIIIIALEKGEYGQKSYRSIESGFDVGKIAEAHGGYGHPAAASVNITKEQREKTLILRKINNRDSLEYLINSSYK